MDKLQIRLLTALPRSSDSSPFGRLGTSPPYCRNTFTWSGVNGGKHLAWFDQVSCGFLIFSQFMVLMLSLCYRETEQEDDSSQAIQNTAKGLYIFVGINFNHRRERTLIRMSWYSHLKVKQSLSLILRE